jgi:hypothetical protein
MLVRRCLLAVSILATAVLLPVAPSGAGVEPTPPSGPAVVRGAYGCNNDIVLTWTAPDDDGGSPITGYTVYADDVAVADVGPDTLTYGPATADPVYSVSASNEIGESEPTIMTEATIPACIITTTTTTTIAETPPRPPDPLPRQPSFTG